MDERDDNNHGDSSDSPLKRPTVALWPRIAAVVIGLSVVAVLLWGPVEFGETMLAVWHNETGPVAVLGFSAFYVVATVVFFPAAILGVGAGFLFGGVAGTVIAVICRPLGALLAFIIGRHLARDHVEHWVEDWPKYAAVDRMTKKEPFRIVLLLRLVPILTFNLTSYVLGLTAVTWKKFVAGTFVGVLPGTLFYVYIGVATGDLTQAAAVDETPAFIDHMATWIVGAIAFVALLTYLFIRGRKYWAQITEEAQDDTAPDTA